MFNLDIKNSRQKIEIPISGSISKVLSLQNATNYPELPADYLYPITF